MSLSISGRRRRIFFTAAALIAGGYASYRLYNSSAVSRRRKQLLRVLNTLSFLGETISNSAESASVISKDLKSFLLSDRNEVPQSLKQAFKIGQCSEFQETLTVLCTSLTEGVLRGLDSDGRRQDAKDHMQYIIDTFARTTASEVVAPTSFGQGKVDLERESAVYGGEGACREIREVQILAKDCHPQLTGKIRIREVNHETSSSKVPGDANSTSETALGTGEEFGWNEWEVNTPGELNAVHYEGRKGPKIRVSAEGLPERLLGKLFTEAGTGFVSAVVGSVARSSILSLLDGLQKWKKEGNRDMIERKEEVGPLWEEGSSKYWEGGSSEDILAETGGVKQMVDSQQGSVNYGISSSKTTMQTQIIDFFCSNKGRSLIAECIQTFVSVAVSVYIDKTKDVNFYDDMVAGIISPNHQAPMKELLTSVCNGAVETFVRTSHDALFVKGADHLGSVSSQQQQGCQVEKLTEQIKGPGHILNINVNPSADVNPSKLQNGLPNNSIEAQTQGNFTTDNGLEVPNYVCDLVSPPECNSTSGKIDGMFLKSNNSRVIKEEKALSAPENVCDMPVGRSLFESGEDKKGIPNWIDGFSKTLAIPSNRKLVVDVAGAVTSEAMRSIFEIMVGTVSSCFGVRRDSQLKIWGSTYHEENGQLQRTFGSIMKDAGAKSLILATICLAICLHVLLGVRMLEAA